MNAFVSRGKVSFERLQLKWSMGSVIWKICWVQMAVLMRLLWC